MSSLIDQLKAALPDIDHEALLRALLIEKYPTRPGWSTLPRPQISLEKKTNAGAFCVAWYKDPERTDPNSWRKGEIMVVLNRRGKEKGPDGQPLWAGTGGGFRDLGTVKMDEVPEGEQWPIKEGDTNPADIDEAGEQPNENVSRELNEETRDADNKPVLDIDPARFTIGNILAVGVDYRQKTPTDYIGYSLELTAEEYKGMKKHAEKLRTDPSYRAAVAEHTKGEVSGYEVLPLTEAMKLTREQFAHPHEFDALRELNERLKLQQKGREASR